MTNSLTIEETIRGHILVALDNDKNGQLADTAVAAVLKGASFSVTEAELKRHVDYLEDKGLVKIEIRNKQLFWVKRTAKGKDLIDGRIEVAGIITPY